MIYLDHGATSFPKPPAVVRSMAWAAGHLANPGRGGYREAMAASQLVYRCREEAADLFSCRPEQVVFTPGCTQALNMAIRTLVKPGMIVAISGFEHNAVTRPLHALGARVRVCGRRLFDPEDTLRDFETALRQGAKAAVFTHVSNVFGYILPVKELAELCRRHGVPFVIDAAQSAGSIPIDFEALGADFVAVPGHKGLLGPQGVGLLLCSRLPDVLIAGGTGSQSENAAMPDFLPDRGEAGTQNVPGIAGLLAGIREVRRRGVENIGARERMLCRECAKALEKLGFRVFSGPCQAGTVSFQPKGDCEELALALGCRGIAVRSGLHCSPLAHESAGTLTGGTVRVSFGHDGSFRQLRGLLRTLEAQSLKKFHD